MSSQLPVVKNASSGAIIYTALAPRAADGTFKSNPTLASGDVKISIDGGAFANLTNLPAVTPASGKAVKITLTQAETNGDTLVILFSDAAGAEWCDRIIAIQTVANNFDSLAVPGSAMTLTNGERNAVADAMLDRDMSVGTDSGSPTVRTVRQALRFLRNKWAIATGTLTVYKEDDTTSSWSSTVTTTAGANPVTGNDPA